MDIEIPDTLEADKSKRDSRYEELKSSDCFEAFRIALTRIPNLLLFSSPLAYSCPVSAFILFTSRDSNL